MTGHDRPSLPPVVVERRYVALIADRLWPATMGVVLTASGARVFFQTVSTPADKWTIVTALVGAFVTFASLARPASVRLRLGFLLTVTVAVFTRGCFLLAAAAGIASSTSASPWNQVVAGLTWIALGIATQAVHALSATVHGHRPPGHRSRR